MWFIRGINLLTRIPVEELDAISRNATTITIDKDKYMKPRGETTKKVWLVKSGLIRLIKRMDLSKEMVIAKLEQGNLFGFYPDETGNVLKLLHAPEMTLCYLFDRDAIVSALQKIPRDSIKIDINLNNKIINFEPELVKFFHQPLSDRILRVMQLLSQNFGIKKSKGIVIKSPELINIICNASFLSEPVVISFLAIMRKMGKMELYEDQIIIKDESIFSQ